MIKDIDKIIGQKIKDIKLLIWDDQKSLFMIEKILFEIDHFKFLLQVEQDTDSMIIKILKDFTLVKSEKEHLIISSENLIQYNLDHLIGKQIIWIWTLTNNQGYLDGIQMEIEKQKTFHFLTIASQIEIKKVEKIESPATHS